MKEKTVSSWSLHRTLGDTHSGDTPGGKLAPRGGGGVDLLQFPEELRKRGYTQLQLCHFHLPSTDAGYLSEFGSAMDDAGITLDALLIDDGNLVDPDHADRDQRWIDGWLSVAESLNAQRARICAGRLSPNPEQLQQSAVRLRELAEAHKGVRVVTENWLELLSDAPAVNTVLDAAGDSVGFMIDLGNWTGSDKYDQLTRVAAKAETCHAKCQFDGEEPDRKDFMRSLQILSDARFSGSIALIYDGPNPDEWAKLEVESDMVQQIFGS